MLSTERDELFGSRVHETSRWLDLKRKLAVTSEACLLLPPGELSTLVCGRLHPKCEINLTKNHFKCVFCTLDKLAEIHGTRLHPRPSPRWPTWSSGRRCKCTPLGPKSALPGELREPKHHAPQVISAPEAKGLGLHGSTGSPFPLPQMH